MRNVNTDQELHGLASLGGGDGYCGLVDVHPEQVSSVGVVGDATNLLRCDQSLAVSSCGVDGDNVAKVIIESGEKNRITLAETGDMLDTTWRDGGHSGDVHVADHPGVGQVEAGLGGHHQDAALGVGNTFLVGRVKNHVCGAGTLVTLAGKRLGQTYMRTFVESARNWQLFFHRYRMSDSDTHGSDASFLDNDLVVLAVVLVAGDNFSGLPV